MDGFKPYNPYPVTYADIMRKLEGKTKEERLQYYDTHREEIRKAWTHERLKAQFLDGGGY